MGSRKRRKKESYLWSTIMVICAIATILVAVLVVVTVFMKIKKDTSQWGNGEKETTVAEIVIETDAVYGWVETEDGVKFREESGEFAKNTWKLWNDSLYYINENEVMEEGGSISLDGQIFTFSDSGILQDIQMDPNYTGTGLDSRVSSTEFYCYLDTDSAYDGEFYPIVYKKAVGDSEEYLGGEEVPEVSSPYSLKIVDGWIYYLPQISGSNSTLSSMEQGVCNKLFRMRPGEKQKELLASSVTGYLEVDGTIYYASGGGIHKAETGTQYPTGEDQFQVRIENGVCYLLDGMGSMVSGDSSGMRTIGDRTYKLDNGKISYVIPAQRSAGGRIYELKNEGGKDALVWTEMATGQTGVLATAEYGINSVCIAENWIYYSAYVQKGGNGERFSQICRISLDGSEQQTVSKLFAGNILNMYYYKGEQTIYGEYSPVSWESAYGQIVTIGLDGTVRMVDDSTVRTAGTNENLMLELLLVKDGTLTCYEHLCQLDVGGQSWSILSTRPIQFSKASQDLVAESMLAAGEEEPVAEETAAEQTSESQEETAAAETQAETLPPEIVPEAPSETVGGQEPGMEQGAVQTVPAPTETTAYAPPGYERPAETVGANQGPEEGPAVIVPVL